MSDVTFPPYMTPGQVFSVGGRKYKLIRTKQVNWLVEDEMGTKWNIRQTSNVKLLEPEDFKGVEKPDGPPLFLGSTVKFASHSPNARKYPGTYVVIKLGSDINSYNLAELNGGDNRYFRSVPASDLEEVDV